MSSSAPCIYLCNKDVLKKNVREREREEGGGKTSVKNRRTNFTHARKNPRTVNVTVSVGVLQANRREGRQRSVSLEGGQVDGPSRDALHHVAVRKCPQHSAISGQLDVLLPSGPHVSVSLHRLSGAASALTRTK